MLNITTNSIKRYVDISGFGSFSSLNARKSGNAVLRILVFTLVACLIIAFVPWTQTIRAPGQVTTIKPDQRPQTIQAVIAGRIEKWYVKEGDFVEKGDTILFISEVKDEYFDPELLKRTQERLGAKESSVDSYMEKVKALDKQIDALIETAGLKQEQAQNKLEQARLKVLSDSTDYQAAKINVKIADEQYERAKGLFDQGLKSRTEMENRELKSQKARAELISAENKLLTSRNEVINARVELSSLSAEYRDAVAKAESEKFTALSSMYDAEETVTKLQNQYMNYAVRIGMYYVTAPQSGYVTQALQSGLGETIKEGVEIVSIMPAEYDLAVEMYVQPIDLPLLDIGRSVRIQFDGWPAIIFSGWPEATFGTYDGRIFAIDNFIGENGKFRVLIEPDNSEKPWPPRLRVGAGTQNLVLLEDVPIWYEVWRQLNGFPPNYYGAQEKVDDVAKK
jgi:multidrug resistance efflux pump